MIARERVAFSAKRFCERDTERNRQILTMRVAFWSTTDEGCVEPVVSNGLICVENDGITLASEHLDLLDGEGLSELAICLNDGYNDAFEPTMKARRKDLETHSNRGCQSTQ